MVKDWDRVKDVVQQLYCAERQALEDVMRVLKVDYDFEASPRAFKMKIKEWGWTTYKRPSNGPDGVARKKQKCRKSAYCANESRGKSTSLSRVDLPVAATSNTGPAQIDMLALKTTTGIERLASGEDLHAAVRKGSFLGVANLLSMVSVKDNIDTTNTEGDTCLHVAVQMQLGDIVDLLIEHGADVNSKGMTGKTALHYALGCCASSQRGIFLRLLEICSVVSEPDDAGDTALHLALRLWPYGLRFFYVIDLLARSVNVNQANRAGVTPFQMLIEDMSDEHYYEVLVGRFLYHKADPNLLVKGKRILSKVFEDRNRIRHAYSLMKLLLRFGASPMCPDSTGDFLVYTVYKHLKAAEADAKQELDSIELNSLLNAMVKPFTLRSQTPIPPHMPWWWRQYRKLRHSYYENGGLSQRLFSGIRDLMTRAIISDSAHAEFLRAIVGYAVDDWLKTNWESRRRSIDAAQCLQDLKDELSKAVRWRREVLQDCKSLGIKMEWNDYGQFQSAIGRLWEASELEHTYDFLMNYEINSELKYLQRCLDYSKG